MAWKDVNKVWQKVKEKGPSHYAWERPSLKNISIQRWLVSYPEVARRAAALAISVVKWSKQNFCEDIRNSKYLCGACVAKWIIPALWDCEDCPIWAGENLAGKPLCSSGSRAWVYERIMAAYTQEWNKLPAKWKEKI
jgi:hypothetical protein